MSFRSAIPAVEIYETSRFPLCPLQLTGIINEAGEKHLVADELDNSITISRERATYLFPSCQKKKRRIKEKERRRERERCRDKTIVNLSQNRAAIHFRLDLSIIRFARIRKVERQSFRSAICG